jgi:hypothetical protein
MEQRPLRLGDIVDDYCPRERRVTNHAIVALVEETVKQTRCTTCDHEHVFKQAKEPRRRKKDETSALYSQVLSGLQPPAPGMPVMPAVAAPSAAAVALAEPEIAVEPPAVTVTIAEPIATAASEPDADQADDEDPDDNIGNVASDNEPWSMHRRLIRAQLPRTGNEPPPARPLPDFTIRQPTSRGGQRPWRGAGGGEPNGNTPNRQGRGGGQGQGQGGGQARPGGRGRFTGPRPDGGRRGGPGQGNGGGRPGGGGGRGRRSR